MQYGLSRRMMKWLCVCASLVVKFMLFYWQENHLWLLNSRLSLVESKTSFNFSLISILVFNQHLEETNSFCHQGMPFFTVDAVWYDLVGGLEHVLFSHSVGNFIIPTDELTFLQRGRYTTNQLWSLYHVNPCQKPMVNIHFLVENHRPQPDPVNSHPVNQWLCWNHQGLPPIFRLSPQVIPWGRFLGRTSGRLSPSYWLPEYVYTYYIY